MGKVSKFFALFLGTIGLLLLLRQTGWMVFSGRQITSIVVFSTFIYGTLLFGEFRLAFAFGGIAALMALNLLTVQRFTESASLDVLVFLIGTCLVIGFLEESQMFEHVVSGVVGWIGPRPQALLICLMMFASVASALVGEVTAILFMAGALLHLTSKYKLNPVPFVIMLVFACNNGSSMSSVGNPIGVLIALKTGLSFVDFLIWAAPTSLVVNVATFLICRWWFKDAFAGFAVAVAKDFDRQRARSAARQAVREEPAAPARSPLLELSPQLATAGLAAEAVIGASPGVVASQAGPSDGHRANAMDESFYDESNAAAAFDGLDARRTYYLCWGLLAGLVILLATHGLTERWLGHMFGSVRDTVVMKGAVREMIEGLPAVAGGQAVSGYSDNLLGKPLPDGRVIAGFEFGLKEGTMMVAAALLMGCIVLVLRREKARELVERRVDWWTLAFFMMLFASVGTLEDTHVTQVIADKIKNIEGGQMVTTQIVGWATGWLSAFLDNVLAVATFVPVVHDIRSATDGPYSSGIYWFMLFGGTFMGNMTIIGSTANIVAVGLLEKRGHGTIGFGYWMKIGTIVAIVSMLIATVMLLVMQQIGLPMMPRPVGPAAGH
jgi:Na+/H+ antiporter NhaD/arsenite permease-like protein